MAIQRLGGVFKRAFAFARSGLNRRRHGQDDTILSKTDARQCMVLK
jgi:hypothetical protein